LSMEIRKERVKNERIEIALMKTKQPSSAK